jgi:hypothetical protein
MSVMALQHVTRSIPIVFVGVVDPVGTGFVDALARPGGNTTGFVEAECLGGLEVDNKLLQCVGSKLALSRRARRSLFRSLSG